MKVDQPAPSKDAFESVAFKRVFECAPETVTSLFYATKASVPFMPYVMDMSANAITQVAPLLEQHRDTLALIDEYACSKLDKIETTTATVRDIVTGVEQSVAPLVNAGIAAVDAAVDSLLPAAEAEAAAAAEPQANDAELEATAEPAEPPAPYAVGLETAKAVKAIRAVTSKAQSRVYAKALENIRNAHVRSEGAVAALRPYTIDLIAYDTSGAAALPAQLLASVKETSTSVLDATQLEERARAALAAASDATHRAFAAIKEAQAAVAGGVARAKARADASVTRARATVDKAIAVIGESKDSLVARSANISREQVTEQVAAALEQLRLKASDLRLQLQSLTKEDVVHAAVTVRDEVYEYLMQRRATALDTPPLEDAAALEGAPATAEPEAAEPEAMHATEPAAATATTAATAQDPTPTPAPAPQPVIKRKISFTMGSESDAELEGESNEAAEKLYA